MSGDGGSVEVSQAPQAPEMKKWGFDHVERDPNAKPMRADQLATADYRSFAKLNQRWLPYASHLRGVTDVPQFLRDHDPAEYGAFGSIDPETYLTNVNEIFKLNSLGNEVQVSNFSNVPLTDADLYEFADAIGEINIQFGGNMDTLPNFMIIPAQHPLLYNDAKKQFMGGRNEGNLIIFSANTFRPKGMPVDPRFKPQLPPQPKMKTATSTLRAKIFHELAHSIEDLYPEVVHKYEASVDGEDPPSEYASARTPKGRIIEDLPETISAKTYGTNADRIKSKHEEALGTLRAEVHKGTGMVGPVIVTCQQLNPTDFQRTWEDWFDHGGEIPASTRVSTPPLSRSRMSEPSPSSDSPRAETRFDQIVRESREEWDKVLANAKTESDRDAAHWKAVSARDNARAAAYEARDRAENAAWDAYYQDNDWRVRKQRLKEARQQYRTALKTANTNYKNRVGPPRPRKGFLARLRGK